MLRKRREPGLTKEFDRFERDGMKVAGVFQNVRVYRGNGQIVQEGKPISPREEKEVTRLCEQIVELSGHE